MEDLEFQFRAKIEVAKECIEICHGDPEATMAETTSALIEIGELKRKMQILRTVVDKLKLQTVRAEKITGYMQNRIEMCDHISENLPKRIVANTEVKEKKKNETEAKTGQNQQVPSTTIPAIRYLSLDDFDKIPKYMKGRLHYDGVNTAIDEFNTALKARYSFLSKGFKAMASMAMKKRYKEMKSQESRETRGVYFVVADDLKNFDTLKTESSRRNIFTIFRHFQLIREIRGPQSLVRYAVVV